MTTAIRADGKKPGKYSDVSNFADPGYLDGKGKPAEDGNGVKRYPLNTAGRVRNAAARFAQNKGRYTSEQQSAIMGKIRAAAKRFGVAISDGDSKSLSGVDRIELTQNAAGGTFLVAVYGDGRRVPLPPNTRASAFKGAPYVWNPQQYPADPHEEDFTKEELALEPCGDETHSDDCDGNHRSVDKCPPSPSGDKSCPPGHPGYTPPADDEGDDGGDGAGDGDEGGDEAGRAAKIHPVEDLLPVDPESGMDLDTSPEGGVHDDEVALGLVAALDSTIVVCYKLAEGNDELRKLLSKARWQINEMRRDRDGGPADDDDVSVKLAEIRAMGGELPPDTLTVGQGLRAIAESGFGDVMQPR